MPISPGARLGPYDVQSRLGGGGMGEVWKEFAAPPLVELDDDIHHRRSMLGGMRATAGDAGIEARAEVGGDARIETRRIVGVLEDVDDALELEVGGPTFLALEPH